MPQNSPSETGADSHRHSAWDSAPRTGSHLRNTTAGARRLAVGVSLVACATVYLQIARFDQSDVIATQAALQPGRPRHVSLPLAVSQQTASLSQATTVAESSADSGNQQAFHTEAIRGQVVWLADALQNKFGISTVPEVAENALALLTTDGQLLPIVENLRGRAFRKDKRLRGTDMEILARRYQHQPLIQILRIYEIVDGKRYEIDYWCDVCAIVMFETGPCACCQDHNRLRKRLAADDDRD